ncbi:chromosome partitioning protein [Micromonospora sp. NPDC049004]|uniref:MinD/ParA family ATP-binding protein n=1 Tax=Micromonospora sp. NPDC049004 TaxID=3154348 RepID=UPI0033D6AAC2
MDKNADRAQVPGQQPVPERDIEPLWPPDPAEQGAGDVVPPWAAVAEQRGGPPPSAPSSAVSPPVAAPPTGRPPVPGQPGAAALPPPSPSDYPSLTGAVPPPSGWGATGPNGARTGWAPAQPSWPPADAPATPPAPTASPAPATPPVPPVPSTAPVPPGVGALVGPGRDTFPPTSGTPATGTRPGATPTEATATPTGAAGTPAAAAGTATGAVDTAAGAASADEPVPGPVNDPPAASGGVDLDLPFSLDRPAATATPADRPTPAGPPISGPVTTDPGTAGPPAAGPSTAGPSTAGPSTAGPATTDPTTAGSTAAGPAAQSGGPTGTGEEGPAVGAARPAAESPWAYPPQRPASPPPSTEDQATVAPPPIPAPPVPPPPPPPAVDQGTGAGQTYAGQTYAGQTYSPAIPGQAGPAPVEPPQQGAVPTPPPGPFPPSPGWYPPPWQQAAAAVPPAPPQQYQETDPVARVPATGYPDATWTPETTAAPTAEDFARRRQVRPADPVATMGVRAVVNKIGLVRLSPGRHEQELKRDIEMVRRNFGGLRQVTVVNPKGGAGKTVAILLLAMTFGQKRGGYVLAWDNNETQGTLGMRAQQDFHSRTVRDMLRDLGQFQGAHGRVGDLSQYVRSQGEGMFDVLASDESATGGEMLTAAAFAEIREVVSRFYKLIFVDTGNNVRAQNWQASMDATDQLVVTMSARNDSAETAARMLDHLEQSGRQRLVRQAVTVVSMPPSRKEIDLPAIQEHFAARTRAVLLAPYERLIDSGEPIRYGGLSSATRDAWLKIAAAVAEGL